MFGKILKGSLLLVFFSSSLLAEADFVDLSVYNAEIRVGIRGDRKGRCVVHKNLAAGLSKVAAVLKLQGFGLKAIKCYLPSGGKDATDHEVRHSRGVCVDVVPVDASGQPMFGPNLDKGMELLKTAMTKERFQSLSWFPEHFDFDIEHWKELYPQQSFPIDAVKATQK